MPDPWRTPTVNVEPYATVVPKTYTRNINMPAKYHKNYILRDFVFGSPSKISDPRAISGLFFASVSVKGKPFMSRLAGVQYREAFFELRQCVLNLFVINETCTDITHVREFETL